VKCNIRRFVLEREIGRVLAAGVVPGTPEAEADEGEPAYERQVIDFHALCPEPLPEGPDLAALPDLAGRVQSLEDAKKAHADVAAARLELRKIEAMKAAVQKRIAQLESEALRLEGEQVAWSERAEAAVPDLDAAKESVDSAQAEHAAARAQQDSVRSAIAARLAGFNALEEAHAIAEATRRLGPGWTIRESAGAVHEWT
jgi:chromosome segregation protein